jgi:hypothetical protein
LPQVSGQSGEVPRDQPARPGAVRAKNVPDPQPHGSFPGGRAWLRCPGPGRPSVVRSTGS